MDVEVRQVRRPERDEVAQGSEVRFELHAMVVSADAERDLGMDAGNELASEVDPVLLGPGRPGGGRKLPLDPLSGSGDIYGQGHLLAILRGEVGEGSIRSGGGQRHLDVPRPVSLSAGVQVGRR